MGSVAPGWTTQDTVWGAYEPGEGSDQFEAQEHTATMPVRFRIRYRSDIDATWRVQFDSRNFPLIAPPVDPDGRRRELHLYTREEVSD